jgi:hypothetical protein
MTIAIILSIIIALATIGIYLVRVGKKVAKLDQAEGVLDAVGKINKMRKEEAKKTDEVIKDGVDSGISNPVAGSFPRVRSPHLRDRG